MKATELMLNDLVMCNNKVCKVCSIEGVMVLVSFKDGEKLTIEDNIEPIPLIPEILEKNGFEKNAMYYVLKIDEDFELWYYPHLGSLRYEYQGELLFKLAGGVNYVHSLQHALKLCGVDKEIAL